MIVFTNLVLKCYRFIGEETTAVSGEKHQLTDEPTWIIDPIDGTTNFVNRLVSRLHNKQVICSVSFY